MNFSLARIFWIKQRKEKKKKGGKLDHWKFRLLIKDGATKKTRKWELKLRRLRLIN